MDLSDVEFWTFLTLVISGLFLSVAIVWWKGCPIALVAEPSFVFWPGALILALRPRRRRDL